MVAVITYKHEKEIKKTPCGSTVTLGRDKNCDIVLTDSHVSRNHAMIRCIGHNDYYLIDSGSSNGSYVNRFRITAPRLLRSGDCITVGQTQLLFTQDVKIIRPTDSLPMIDTIIRDLPDIRQITILVADIRGFTSLSERVNIRTLSKFMNAWFHKVSNAIFANGGTVDKFIGDCVFACWETELGHKKTVEQALRAAYQINRITGELGQSYIEIAEQIHIGVGINTGVASLGIGQDNTAMGDAVNVAFRLESATKLLATDIVISETAYRHLPDNLLHGKKQHIRVKGKRDPVRICCLKFQELEKILQELYSDVKQERVKEF
ncbi:MAG: adenylate/guanylate cyclase domain-containing protein [Gammaproteobacteria bacterium]|nr:adenylate/guanylate cyclase domain-containing protein [Gammaproteobacteria bacterium]